MSIGRSHADRGNGPGRALCSDRLSGIVDAAKPLAEARRSSRGASTSRTRFVPKQWENGPTTPGSANIQPTGASPDSCGGGHRIPAWYGPDGAVFVERREGDALVAAEQRFGKPVEVVERAVPLARVAGGGCAGLDPELRSTATRTCSTPGSPRRCGPFRACSDGPEKTAESRSAGTRPSVLITGFDIIFFWVARMMFDGPALHEARCRSATVYIHALVRDEKGQKMSKSKGNVMDPLDLIDEYGADALRFTLAAMAAQGRDIKLATSRVAGYRNFATKLWNAARFCEMNGCRRVEGFDPIAARETVNRWIAVETARTIATITDALETYRFNEAAGAAYRFVWNTFCDWYLELAKPIFSGEDQTAQAETRAMAAWVLDHILVLLHPFMPFVTEELWRLTGEEGPARETMLVVARWPDLDVFDEAAADEINWLVDLIGQIRSVRAEMSVPPATQLSIVVAGAGGETRRRLATHDAAIKRLARVELIELADAAPENAVQIVIGDALVCLPLAGVIDVDAERARLDKELAKVDGDIARIDKKLGNPQFLQKAPEEVVDAEREKARRSAGAPRQDRTGDRSARKRGLIGVGTCINGIGVKAIRIRMATCGTGPCAVRE